MPFQCFVLLTSPFPCCPLVRDVKTSFEQLASLPQGFVAGGCFPRSLPRSLSLLFNYKLGSVRHHLSSSFIIFNRCTFWALQQTDQAYGACYSACEICLFKINNTIVSSDEVSGNEGGNPPKHLNSKASSILNLSCAVVCHSPDVSTLL